MQKSIYGPLTFKHLLGLFALLLLTGVILILLAVKIRYINITFGGIVGCQNCFVKNVLIFEGTFLGALLLIYMLSLALLKRWIYLVMRIIVLAGLALYAADYAISQNLYTRLKVGDIQTYGKQAHLILDHIRSTDMLGQHALTILSLAFLLFIFLLLCPPVRMRWKLLALISALPLTWIAVGLLAPPTIYVHNWAMRNVIAANFSSGVAVNYSDDYQQRLFASDDPPVQCSTKAQTKGDVVLLILESWSPYQSQLWGGEFNWTPKIDDIAKRNMWFSNFYAGGFTTNEGLSSILAGVEFYSPVKNFFDAIMFEGLWNLQNTVPHALNKAGYESFFLTTGDLSFGEKGPWLKNIGFTHIEGHDFAGYDQLPRLHFRSAADEHLYARALEVINNKNSLEQKPKFVTIENVSTHQPFIHPHTREQNKEAVFRYMDDTVADFYNNLERSNFFQNGGILVVVSDHRSMTPISKFENDTLGLLAASKIPAFVAAKQIDAQVVDAIYHQSDILATLEQYTNPACAPHKGKSLLNPVEVAPRCVFHARGDQRDYIDAICSEGKGQVQLHGDNTSFIQTENISPVQQQLLLDRINLVRLRQREPLAITLD